MTDPKSDYMFLHPESLEVAGLRLRPFSIGTYNLIQRLKIKLDGELPDAEQMRNIAAIAWIQSAPIPEVLRAVHTGKSDEAIDAFMFSIDLSRIGELSSELNRIGEAVTPPASASKPNPATKRNPQPPN
jgi:hypothetical protein